MVDLFDFFRRFPHCFLVRVLKNQKRERALIKILEHIPLTLDGVEAFGEIVKHIVIYAGANHSDYRWYHQRQSDYQNNDAGSHDCFSKLHLQNHSLSFFRYILYSNTIKEQTDKENCLTVFQTSF